MTSPLIATYVLVDIPFERTAPDQRKFYIHQRRLDSSLSNWDRWSRDWTWTLDELMGLAADKRLVCAPGKIDDEDKLAEAEVNDKIVDDDDNDDDEVSDIAAVVEEAEIHPVPSSLSSVASKLVVQRCWLKECITAGRVLDQDCGWYVECVEGWQYPEWDKPRPEADTAVGTDDHSKWTWGVRVDEYGFGFGWRKEPVSRYAPAPLPALSPPRQRDGTLPWCVPPMRVVSDPVFPDQRSITRSPSPVPLPSRPQPPPSWQPPPPTAAELAHRDEIDRRMNENRRFSFNRASGLV